MEVAASNYRHPTRVSIPGVLNFTDDPHALIDHDSTRTTTSPPHLTSPLLPLCSAQSTTKSRTSHPTACYPCPAVPTTIDWGETHVRQGTGVDITLFLQ